MDPNNNTGGAAPAASTSVTPKPDAAPAAIATETVASSNPPAVETSSTAPAAPATSTSEAPPAKVETPAPNSTAPESPKTATTILGTEPPKPADKTVAPDPNAKSADDKPAEQKKEEGGQSAEPAPLPTYESFTLPEGVQVDEKRLGEFTKELGEFESANKVEHTKVQEFAQKLVNRYVTETQDTVKRVVDHYTNTWEKQKNEWRESFIADPELGGNRQETTAKNVQNFVSEFGGTAEQATNLRTFMESGIGNNPLLIRLMNNAANQIKAHAETIAGLREKYETESNKQLPGRQPEASKKSKTQTLYGKTSASS